MKKFLVGLMLVLGLIGAVSGVVGAEGKTKSSSTVVANEYGGTW